MDQIAILYNWIENNYQSLETAYNCLDYPKRKEVPFALYCVAMFYKHHTELN
jgi:hypothetical protein